MARFRLGKGNLSDAIDFIAQVDPEGAERLRLSQTDGGRFLKEAAQAGDRWSRVIERTEQIAGQLAREGRWEENFEWRISTDGNDRLERLADDRFRASCDYHGEFSVEFPTFARAYEAVRVLGAIQRALFYATGWSGSPKPTTDAPRNEGERYLGGLAAESRRAGGPLTVEIAEALATAGDWSEAGRSVTPVTLPTWHGSAEALHLEVAQDSLVLATDAPTVERAVEFMGVYTALQLDLRRILDWSPL